MTRAAKKVAARSLRECRTTASTGPGQKSHVERRKASVPSLGTQDASRTHVGLARYAKKSRACPVCADRSHAGSARLAQAMRRLHAGHGMPRRVPRTHPSATGAPHAPRKGAKLETAGAE